VRRGAESGTGAVSKFLGVAVAVLGVSVGVFPATSLAATNDPFCAAPAGNGRQGAGTLKMIALLQQIIRSPEVLSSPFQNDLIVQRIEDSITKSTNSAQQLSLRIQYANQLLQAGRNTDSLREFERVITTLNAQQLEMSPQGKFLMRVQRAMAYLRLGEQENCLLNHTSESCLVPSRWCASEPARFAGGHQ
jgi:hypothetical protein